MLNPTIDTTCFLLIAINNNMVKATIPKMTPIPWVIAFIISSFKLYLFKSCTSSNAEIGYISCSVRTIGPFSVIAIVCSNCADNLPSNVLAVHLLSSTFNLYVPMLTIGSIVITIPS